MVKNISLLIFFVWLGFRTYYNRKKGVDSRILQLSLAAGADLTPLIHFWGVHPVNPTALTAKGLGSVHQM